ncbi:GNAT family N-acetyltransferase [Paraburkholderia ferrariae]|uniref:GNAT family N-acetyltransferase n=1 Tax=Paraburkholderia ferrariae TaxID=386056 RepID=UPI000A047F2F|nr:GNAT family N-acetyltransferase [Paraburkholderia ferrariae]
MPYARVATESNEWIVREQPETGRLVIRPFDHECDSMALVTKLLRRAAASHETQRECAEDRAGNAYARHHYAVEETCFVAVCGGRLAGTIALQGPDPASACPHFRRPDVATLCRYGVEPSLQRRGIGRALLSFGNRWAAAHGYLQLALATPVTERSLFDFYHAQGFSLIDTVRCAGCDCDSAVFSRPTLAGWPCFATSRATHRVRGRR